MPIPSHKFLKAAGQAALFLCALGLGSVVRADDDNGSGVDLDETGFGDSSSRAHGHIWNPRMFGDSSKDRTKQHDSRPRPFDFLAAVEREDR